MKLFLKIIGSTLLIVLCLAVLAFTGFFLWSAIPRERPEPQVLSTEALFQEEVEAAPPAEIVAPTEELVETPPEEPVEEEPTEEPPVEEPEEPEEPKEPPVEEEPPQPAYDEMALAYLQNMTLEEKLWQLFITTPEDLTGQSPVTIASPWTQEALETKPVGGLVYFSQNLLDSRQTKEMLWQTQMYAETPLFLAVDEEGGQVSRLGANPEMGVTWFDPAATYGESGDTAQVYNIGKTLAQELSELGFNLDFAPVADIVTNPNNTEIGNRAYSTDPEVAAPMVAAMVDGLQRGGVAACLKHFPGHGSTEANSHLGLSVSERTVEQMKAEEWRTFAAGIAADAAFVMVGHLSNFSISEDPSSLSPEIMTYLREDLNFDGIIITDSLKMGAILNSYTSAQAAVMAIAAGADMLLLPNDLLTAFTGLLAAVQDGTITEERIDESVLRILQTKYELGIMTLPVEEPAAE